MMLDSKGNRKVVLTPEELSPLVPDSGNQLNRHVLKAQEQHKLNTIINKFPSFTKEGLGQMLRSNASIKSH